MGGGGGVPTEFGCGGSLWKMCGCVCVCATVRAESRGSSATAEAPGARQTSTMYWLDRQKKGKRRWACTRTPFDDQPLKSTSPLHLSARFSFPGSCCDSKNKKGPEARRQKRGRSSEKDRGGHEGVSSLFSFRNKRLRCFLGEGLTYEDCNADRRSRTSKAGGVEEARCARLLSSARGETPHDGACPLVPLLASAPFGEVSSEDVLFCY